MKLELNSIEELKQLAALLDGRNDDVLQEILAQGAKIMATQTEIVAQLNATTEQLKKIGTETTSLLTKVDELLAVINAGPVTPELQAAVDALQAQATTVDNLVSDVTPPPA